MAKKKVEVTFDRKKFKGMAGKAFNKVIGIALENIQEQITEPLRPYPPDRVTIRKNGRVVKGGPRDVVDLGKLRDSYEELKGKRAAFGSGEITLGAKWIAKHASYIYFGTKYQPAYPWVQIGLRKVDLVALYRKELKKIK